VAAIGGANTQVQYNNSGSLAGSADFVFDGTNVGIGTSLPSTLLHVSGDSSPVILNQNIAGNIATFTALGVTYGASFGVNASGTYITSGANTVFSAGGSETVRIDASGNVGIGNTPSGTYKLQVTGALFASSAVLGAPLPVASGGTGASTAPTARTSLGAAASGANTDITSIALTTGTISASPTSGTDIVNKVYADSIASGINFHQSVRLATAAALPANTYNNGASGVGATLTANANGALSVDGVAVVAGNRILVKNEVAGANNGVYTVTQIGSGAAPYILTRATDFDSAGTGVDQIDAGDFFLVTAGSTQSNTSWVQQTPLPVTVGTTAIVFTQFAAPVLYSAGTGLTLGGTVFSITNTGVTASTYGSASSVPVIAVNAQGQITSASSSSIAIAASQITSGVLAVANGGTGVATSTGTGSVVLSNSPTLVTPTLGAASATSITNGLGAVGTPSYTFTGDTNTGMWSPAADTLAFSEGGAEVMRITSAGDVGIGTTAPGKRLEVNAVGANAAIRLKETATYGVNWDIDVGSANAMAFNNNAGSALSYVFLKGDLQVSRGATGVAADAAINFGSNANNYIFSGNTNNIMAFATNGSERMRIDSSGNVGIGTSGPTTQLDVHGTGTLALRRDATDSTSQILLSQAGTGDSVIDFLLPGVRAWRMGIDNSDSDKFKLQPSQTADFSGAVVTVDTSGNVGIGTASPGQKLTVAGTIETTSGGVKFPDSTTQTTASFGVNIQDFTTPGTTTWTKPAGAKVIEVHVWSGGGGGGAGFSGAATSTPGGGGGAISGKYSCTTFIATDAGSTETVIVGAGGTGALASPTVGGNGGPSSFGSFIALAQGNGASSGAVNLGGSTTTDSLSTTVSPILFGWIARGLGTSGGAGGTAPTGASNSGAMAGGGGGAGSSGTAIAGATGARGSTYGSDPAYPAFVGGSLNASTGPAGGTAPGGAGTNGTARFRGGDGGGGGASVVTGTGGKGGNGGYPGGGGGGGGAAWNGTGGAGGDGAAGRVRVITYF
jgi:hypothetical protein